MLVMTMKTANQEKKLQVGDHVLINILGGINRMNTDKHNFEAEVIEVSADDKRVRVP